MNLNLKYGLTLVVRDLLWSLHKSTTYLLLVLWDLNTLKKTAVYSCKPFEAKTSNPNGPKPPLNEAPFSLHKICGSVQLGSNTSAFSKSLISNVTSISACKTEDHPTKAKEYQSLKSYSNIESGIYVLFSNTWQKPITLIKNKHAYLCCCDTKYFMKRSFLKHSTWQFDLLCSQLFKFYNGPLHQLFPRLIKQNGPWNCLCNKPIIVLIQFISHHIKDYSIPIAILIIEQLLIVIGCA